MSNEKSDRTCLFTIRYHEEKILEFLQSTHLNPGTWVKPIGMDHLVHVQSSLEKDFDPSISEIPAEVNRIVWQIMSEPDQISIFSTKLCFVRFVCLDKDRKDYPDKKYWRQAFEKNSIKGKRGQIAPDGALYLLPNGQGEIDVKLIEEDRKELFLGYSVSFCLQHRSTEGILMEYYCSVDPFARIRPTSP